MNMNGYDEPTSAQQVEAQRMLNMYGGKSEDELMRELLSAAAKQKQDGSFDAAGMRRTAASLMPMLNAEQQRKLLNIISALEN